MKNVASRHWRSLWMLVPVACCGIPVWMVNTPSPVQRDFDDIRPGITVDELIAAFPHELSASPDYASSVSLTEHLRRNPDLKHFSGWLCNPGGGVLRFRGNLVYDGLSPEEIKQRGIKPGETALQFAARKPEWRVRDGGENFNAYLRTNPDHRATFSGTLSHFPSPPLWRMREMEHNLVVVVKEGRVIRTKREPLSD